MRVCNETTKKCIDQIVRQYGIQFCLRKNSVGADINHFPSLKGLDLEQSRNNYEIISLDLEKLLDYNETLPCL